MQLTPHFTLAELTHSTTAKRLGLDNTPTDKVIQNLEATAVMLECIRAHLGGVPVIVTSGYRSPAVNSAVGGVTSSDHRTGSAADILAPRFGTPYDIAKALAPPIDDRGIGQLIYEVAGQSRWVHVSTCTPRMRVNRVITIVAGKPTQLGIQKC